MIVWLKDVKGGLYRIKCAKWDYLKGNTYVFYDAQENRVAQFNEQNIIGFKVRRSKSERQSGKEV